MTSPPAPPSGGGSGGSGGSGGGSGGGGTPPPPPEPTPEERRQEFNSSAGAVPGSATLAKSPTPGALRSIVDRINAQAAAVVSQQMASSVALGATRLAKQGAVYAAIKVGLDGIVKLSGSSQRSYAGPWDQAIFDVQAKRAITHKNKVGVAHEHTWYGWEGTKWYTYKTERGMWPPYGEGTIEFQRAYFGVKRKLFGASIAVSLAYHLVFDAAEIFYVSVKMVDVVGWGWDHDKEYFIYKVIRKVFKPDPAGGVV